ncbi:MAG: DUF2244 domain-containing protein [Alphaproteobacteria bacterium]
MMQATLKDPVYFEAWLYPYRSLSPQGCRLLTMGIAVLGMMMGFIFWSLGAWPIVGFCGAEFGLFALLFHMNCRDTKRGEKLALTNRSLRIEQFDTKGRVQNATELSPGWLRVKLISKDSSKGGLFLTTHGRTVVIGKFLPTNERIDLAEKLQQALSIWRRGAQT